MDILQNCKTAYYLSGFALSHALNPSLDKCLDMLVSDYADLIDLTQFSDNRRVAREVFASCLFMAQHGRSAWTKNEYEAFCNAFGVNNNAQAIAKTLQIFIYMRDAIEMKMPFLNEANIKDLFLLLLKQPKSMLDEYQPHLNDFLISCSCDDALMSSCNRTDEESQVDAIEEALEEFIMPVRAEYEEEFA